MEMIVHLEKDSYPIYIQNNLVIKHLKSYIKQVFKGSKIVIITDSRVHNLYYDMVYHQLKDDYEVFLICVEEGEHSKSFELLPEIYEQLLDIHFTRKDLIIGLGGGVIGDLSGFIASTFLRGVSFVQIPTTLLAQVDSSVGGKVGVNLPQGKNLVGAFKHPLMVLIDPLLLKTLSDEVMSDGMGEVIKYACLFDEQLFDQIALVQSLFELNIEQVIYKCVNYKRILVEKDLYDLSERIALNFGHTLGHAIEQYYHYDSYRHGQAVAIGMVQITRISEMHHITKEGTSKRIEDVCLQYHLPVCSHLKIEELKKAMSLDKKNLNKQLSYVLLNKIGQYNIYPSDLSFVDLVEEV